MDMRWLAGDTPRLATAMPAPPTDRIALADGRSVTVRPLQAQDADAEQHFVRSLSPGSRVLRFHLGIRELSPETLRALTQIDQRRHVAVVAQGDEDPEAIVADARYVLLDDGDEAEFAIAVADEWQGAGLGRQLMAWLMQHARRNGVRALFGDVLHDNHRMIAMVRDAGGRFVRHPGDATLTRARFVL
jgi:GNAT superfamily N-acetyltransferase